MSARTSPAALIPRTAALFILLYQVRLFAADLADTPLFIASLATSLLTAIFLHCQRVRRSSPGPLQAIIIIALVPWVIRFFIALPRWLVVGIFDAHDISGTAIVLDSLLLNLDRNNFSALLPFYWVAITTYFSLKSRTFLRADIIAADTLFLVLFSIMPSASMNAYRWPILMIGLFALVLFLQILTLVLSTAPGIKLSGKEKISAGAFLFLLVFLGAALFIRPFQERAVERGGGLLEPRLFRFDFSQILKLESEISVNDDLVLIVKKKRDDYHNLLRRYTLSGYSSKQGFYRLEGMDEAAHPQHLPNRHSLLPAKEIKNFSLTEQEYYLVNFDASAFIGMNMPVEVTPFESWDASSFNSAYGVKSHTSEALPYELAMAVSGEPGDENLLLSPEEFAIYTEYGGDEAIASFAREIIRGSSSYWDQIQLVYEKLKYGEYRYSLKPGIAPDGDQLKYFLFNSKKGYCSYYAFAFSLMLRSLGIPCRLAAGFFVDPYTEAFDYYPVRSDMAHAWVEVWFPQYGWIEYDPTSQVMAEGEEFRYSQGTPPELFERLIKEIFENRSGLRAKEGEDAESRGINLAAFGSLALRFLRHWGPLLAAFILLIVLLALRFGFLWLSALYRDKRKKALWLWAHIKRRFALGGFGNTPGVGEAEWAKALDRRVSGLYLLYLDVAAARFAQDFTGQDFLNMREHYRFFCGEYQKYAGKHKGRHTGAALLIAALLIALLYQDTPADEYSNELYVNAQAAQKAENWERAIELYNAGAKADPEDFRFPWALGELYFNRRLYRLAWDEYHRAEAIIPSEAPDSQQKSALFFKLATTAGYLNRNEASADYLERLLVLENDNREAIGNLAWMYFKLHRLSEGETLLLDAMDRLGEDMDFAMTLGTIYSDMFRYEEAKEAYQKAIRSAEASGDRLFAALSHYNLSIMESRFYFFDLAYESTNSSLEAMNRASGRLSRGELFARRMELSRALDECQEAYSMDNSPLSKLNLAQILRIGGRLNDALLYANDCLKAGDESWMMNYGIDPVRYKRDIHEILRDSYRGLWKAEKFSSPAGLKEALQSLFRKISYRFRFNLHKHLFQKYSLLSADAYRINRKGEIHLEALIQYFNAFEAYPGRALAYLHRARAYEEKLIPASGPSYDFEEGRLTKGRESIKTLRKTIGEFDPLWERDMIARAYEELASRGKKAERQDAAERLFAINPGALLQNGIKLPVQLEIAKPVIHLEGLLKKTVKTAGFESARLIAPRYTLSFNSEQEGYVSCELYDAGRGLSLWKQNLPYSVSNRVAKQRFKVTLSQALKEAVFDAF